MGGGGVVRVVGVVGIVAAVVAVWAGVARALFAYVWVGSWLSSSLSRNVEGA